VQADKSAAPAQAWVPVQVEPSQAQPLIAVHVGESVPVLQVFTTVGAPEQVPAQVQPLIAPHVGASVPVLQFLTVVGVPAHVPTLVDQAHPTCALHAFAPASVVMLLQLTAPVWVPVQPLQAHPACSPVVQAV
jgi:hypothetical protein